MNTSVFAIGNNGRVLGTRELGRELADKVRKVIAEADGAVIVDFNGVEVASSPVLDELACAMRAALQDHDGQILVLTHLNRDVHETLQLVLENRDMALTVLDHDQLKLLGGRDHLDKTLAGAQKLGTFTAAELAEELEVKLPNLHHRLTQLQSAGALTRKQSGNGRTINFAVATAEDLVTA
jgi:anti-anti-sigma regulatory factor